MKKVKLKRPEKYPLLPDVEYTVKPSFGYYIHYLPNRDEWSVSSRYVEESPHIFEEVPPKVEPKKGWCKSIWSDGATTVEAIIFIEDETQKAYGWDYDDYWTSEPSIEWRSHKYYKIEEISDEELLTRFGRELKRRYDTPCFVSYLDTGLDRLAGYAFELHREENKISVSCDDYDQEGNSVNPHDVLYKDGEWALSDQGSEEAFIDLYSLKKELKLEISYASNPNKNYERVYKDGVYFALERIENLANKKLKGE